MAREPFGLSEFGFQNYFVTVNITNAGSMSKFWFQVDEGDGSAPVVVEKSWSVSQDCVLANLTRTTRDVGAGTANVVLAVRL